MALANLTQLRSHLLGAPGMSGANSALNATLQQILDEACQAVISRLDSPIEAATYTEIISGQGQRDLMLKYRPVNTLANFALYLDPLGYGGYGNNAFANATLQTAGTDYVLVQDAPNSSRTGIVRRIGMGFGFETVGRPYGSLATRGYRYPVWPVGEQNIKVTYTGGYANVPPDIQGGVLQLAATIYRTRIYGGQFQAAESLGEYRTTLVALTQQPGADLPGGVMYFLKPYYSYPV